MATKVHMEALSPTMEEGQIVRWVKSEGDQVVSGDVLAEIETDKATMELVARGDGVLRRILLGEGGVAPVGDVIGVIAEADEDISDLAAAAPGRPDGEVSVEVSAVDTPAVDTPAVDAPTVEAPVGRIKASPVARRLADEAGVDLTRVRGSGPGGRIVKKDIEEAARAAAPAMQDAGPVPWDGEAVEGYEDLRVSQMRKTIARRLTESLSPVPHFFLTVEVDMARVIEARTRMNSLLAAAGDKLSFNDFVLKATAAALVRHPECNAAWHGDVVRRFRHVHIGVAVAVEDGLITPVVKHADRKGLVQISREVREMAGRAREKRLTPDEYTGSTFSVSNLGMFGIHEFTAIINPPEAGILAIGGLEETAAVIDGELSVRSRMKVTMSCDHRVIDGAQGARYLQTFRAMLEEPAAILL